MKKILLFLFLFNIMLVSADLGVGMKGGLGVDLIPAAGVNYSTVNVNNSDFWDGLDTPADITANGIWTRSGTNVHLTNRRDTVNLTDRTVIDWRNANNPIFEILDYDGIGDLEMIMNVTEDNVYVEPPTYFDTRIGINKVPGSRALEMDGSALIESSGATTWEIADINAPTSSSQIILSYYESFLYNPYGFIKGVYKDGLNIYGQDELYLGTNSGDKYAITIDSNGDVNMSGMLNVTTDVCIIGGNCLSDASTIADGSINSSAWNRTAGNVFLANTGDNVGIGTSTPESELSIVSDGQNPTIIANGSVFTASSFVVNEDAQGRMDLYLTDNVGTKNIFLTGNTIQDNYLGVGALSDVGIGTTTPTHKLNVVGSTNITENLIVHNVSALGNIATLDKTKAVSLVYHFPAVFGQTGLSGLLMEVETNPNVPNIAGSFNAMQGNMYWNGSKFKLTSDHNIRGLSYTPAVGSITGQTGNMGMDNIDNPATTGSLTTTGIQITGLTALQGLMGGGGSGTLNVTNVQGLLATGFTKTGDKSTRIHNVYGVKINDGLYGTNSDISNNTGLFVQKITGATNNYGIVLDGNGAGADIVFGDNRQSSMYYDGTDLIINPRAVGSGNLIVQSGLEVTTNNITFTDFKFSNLSRSSLIDGSVFGLLMTNPPNDEAPHFWIQSGGGGQASGVARSFMIVNENTTRLNSDERTDCQGWADEFNKTLLIDCNTTTTGADLMVGDDMQIFGTIYTEEITPDSYTIWNGDGSLDSGEIANMSNMMGEDIIFNEVTGSPGLDISFNFTTEPEAPKYVVIRWKYTGGSGHDLSWDIYDYDTSSWKTIRGFTDTGADYDSMTMILPNNLVGDYVDDNNQFQIRAYQVDSGNAGHDLQIDYMGVKY